MDRLEVIFKVVTPLFMGGAHSVQNGATHIKADIRAPSIKGALRYWYRAVDPQYRDNENRVFGATGEKGGQGSFLLRVSDGQPKTEVWVSAFKEKGNEKSAINGLTYFGFPLTMKEARDKPPPDREFVPPGLTFKVEAIFREHPNERDQQRILAAFWLLGHVGGLGFRSRRGYGTVALKSWSLVEGEWSEIANLQLADGAGTPEEWMQTFEQGLRTLRTWFPNSEGEPDHLVLAGARFVLRRDGRRDGLPSDSERGRPAQTYDAWAHGLDAAGKLMQRFRQRKPPEDYASVKSHLVKILKLDGERAGVTPLKLRVAPERVRFGLPFTVRYSSLRDLNHGQVPSITFQGAAKDRDRSASPVWVRIVEIGDQCYPLFGVFPAPLLPPGEKVGAGGASQDTPRDEKVGAGRASQDTFDVPGRDILDRFLEYLKTVDAPVNNGGKATVSAPAGLEVKA